VSRAVLHVAPSNAPALALYRACGFSVDSVVQDYYAPGAHAVRMALELGASGTLPAAADPG
jgi:ribosomal protein S18 acetylase RimI-like enzyme